MFDQTFDPTNEMAYLADWLDWSDGEFRYCHRWIPCKQARQVKHVCVAIHGLGDHGGRFAELGKYLAERGVPLQAVDLIGHGRSPGKRGRIRSYDDLLDEIHWSIREANQVWRNANITLLGHSMGGNLALTYAAKRIQSHAHDESPVTIPIDVRVKPTKLIALAPMLRPYGKQIRDDFFRVGCKLAQWVPNWPMKMHSKPELLTMDKNRQARYMSDKLMHRTMSIRLGIELLLSGQSLTNAQTIPAIESVLVHGTEDRLADIEASRELSRRGSNVKLVELYDELHDPLNGADPDYVFQLIHATCLGEEDSLQTDYGSRRVA